MGRRYGQGIVQSIHWSRAASTSISCPRWACVCKRNHRSNERVANHFRSTSSGWMCRFEREKTYKRSVPWFSETKGGASKMSVFSGTFHLRKQDETQNGRDGACSNAGSSECHYLLRRRPQSQCFSRSTTMPKGRTVTSRGLNCGVLRVGNASRRAALRLLNFFDFFVTPVTDRLSRFLDLVLYLQTIPPISLQYS